MNLFRKPVLLAALATLILAGCGNTVDNQQQRSAIKTAVTSLFNRDKSATPGVTVDQINSVLASSPRPVAFVQIDSKSVQTLIIQIAENGPYKTFATADRRSITVRNGTVTATRGLGGDLMSSEESALLSLVQTRTAGTTPYIMRFLDGENVTQDLRLQCRTELGDTAAVQLGEIDTVGQVVIARCTGDRTKFTNTYVVDTSGRVLSTRQWIGPFNGFIAIQMLRL